MGEAERRGTGELKVVLAYSGGLDTSVAIKVLQDRGCDVVTLAVDVGQRNDLKSIGERARALDVAAHHYVDARQEFVEGYVFRAIKANALYQGKYPLSSALSRPLIASKLIEVARKEGAEAVAHGCTGKGNDQIRFEVTIRALAPDLEVIAPIRDRRWTRDKVLEYAKKYGVPIPERAKYSVDENLWGRSVECGPLEYPEQEPPPDAFEWTVDPEKAPDRAE